MKKLLSTLVFMMLLISSNNAFSQVKIDEVGVGATIDIGRNSTGNCSRFGLCTKKIKVKLTIKVKVLTSSNSEAKQALDRSGLGSNQYNAIVYYDGTKLFFYLDKANVDAINKYTGSQSFLVEEDYIFTEPDASVSKYKIAKGTYKYQYDSAKDLYLVTF